MKKKQILLSISLFLFSLNSVVAQFGNQGYGTNSSGRGFGSGMAHPVHEPEKPKEIPAEEVAKKIMESIKTKLKLDELQEIAIANTITKSIKSEGVIMKRGESNDTKLEDIKVLSETTDRKIMELLNKEQKEKYKLMIDERQR